VVVREAIMTQVWEEAARGGYRPGRIGIIAAAIFRAR